MTYDEAREIAIAQMAATLLAAQGPPLDAAHVIERHRTIQSVDLAKRIFTEVESRGVWYPGTGDDVEKVP